MKRVGTLLGYSTTSAAYKVTRTEIMAAKEIGRAPENLSVERNKAGERKGSAQKKSERAPFRVLARLSELAVYAPGAKGFSDGCGL